MRNTYVKHMARLSRACVLVLFWGVPTTAVAQTEFELPLRGISIVTGADGEWAEIYATGIQPVTFPDRRGINTAQTIAEERAKVVFVEFFESSETTFERLTTEMVGESAVTQSGQTEAVRTVATSMNETIRSYVKGSLRGVVVLEAGYDEAREEAWVRMGMTRATIATAGSLRRTLQGQGRAPGEQAAPPSSAAPVTSQPSEIRRRSLPQ